MNVKCIDQLGAFHLHDLSRLTPGVRVLIGHVGKVSFVVPSSKFKKKAVGHLGTITRTTNISFNELHGYTDTDNDLSSIEQSVIFYQSDELGSKDYITRTKFGSVAFIYASDAGVNVYDSGLRSKTNFIVVLSDLDQAGVELSLTPSAAYTSRLVEYNNRFPARDFETTKHER